MTNAIEPTPATDDRVPAATADADVEGLAKHLEECEWPIYEATARAAIAYLTPIIRERCARRAEAEKTSGETNTDSEASYNMACDHIATAIRRGE